jgi:hypothetical protein
MVDPKAGSTVRQDPDLGNRAPGHLLLRVLTGNPWRKPMLSGIPRKDVG